MTGNGHDPAVTDLGAILERTRPARTLLLPIAAVREDSLTLMELALIGRTLGVTPADLSAEMSTPSGNWITAEMGQAFAWVIARREEPGLTWQEAQTFRLEVTGRPPDPPTPASAGASTTPGPASPSTSPASPGSHPPKRAG